MAHLAATHCIALYVRPGMSQCQIMRAQYKDKTYRLLVSGPARQVNVVDLRFEDGSRLCKGNMRGVLRAEGEGLWEALGSRPEEAACASGGILWEGVH